MGTHDELVDEVVVEVVLYMNISGEKGKISRLVGAYHGACGRGTV